jgi:hypothetical protein
VEHQHRITCVGQPQPHCEVEQLGLSAVDRSVSINLRTQSKIEGNSQTKEMINVIA